LDFTGKTNIFMAWKVQKYSGNNPDEAVPTTSKKNAQFYIKPKDTI
jgi:hypothetical protein